MRVHPLFLYRRCKHTFYGWQNFPTEILLFTYFLPTKTAKTGDVKKKNVRNRVEENFLFERLIDDVFLRRKKSLSRRFTSQELEALEVTLGMGRSTIQGYFRADSSKRGRVPHLHMRDAIAQLDNAYENYEDFVSQYYAKQSKDKEGASLLNGDQLIDNLKRTYSSRYEFSTIPILNASNADLSFTVADLYIDISYVNRQELKSSNDYFVIEKEGISSKRNRKSSGDIFTSYVSIETVTEKLILENEHAVLMGNPGVGKTTYGRWICYQWASGKIKLSRHPIYIACRELIASSPNAIISYISEVYFMGDYNSAYRILTSQESSYILLLDGYDEASPEQKTILDRDLKRLTKRGDYPPLALLSRPYALIDSPFSRIPVCYELLGFNKPSRMRYVINFFEKTGCLQDVEAFFEHLSHYDVLEELSFTPLYLSYITSIFVFEDGFNSLKSIHSSYDLNKKALTYSLEHHVRTKNIHRSNYLDALIKSLPFIAELELNLSFVYHSKDLLDKNFRYSEILSELGIGRLEENNDKKAWYFYVLNVHFQETLAAEYFGPRITKEALLYLLGNPLYWHLAKLLVGYLISDKRIHIYIDILHTLRTAALGKLNHNARLYFILLSEANPETLNNIIEDADIANLIENYRWLYTDNQWNTLYFESISRIYKKLSRNRQGHFVQVVIQVIQYNLVIPEATNRMYTQEEVAAVSFPMFLHPIIEQLRLFENKELAGVLIDKYIELEIASQERFGWIEKKRKAKIQLELLDHWAEEEIDHSRYTLLVILDQVDDIDLLTPYKKLFWSALETTTLYVALIARIIAKIESFDTIESLFLKLLKKKSLTADNVIMLSLLSVSLTTTTVYYEKRETVNGYLRAVKPELETLLSAKKNSAARKTHLIARGYYALALTQTDDISMFPLLVWANALRTTEFYMMHDLATKDCHKILDDFFEKCLSKIPELLDIQEFISIVMSMDIGHIILDNYYVRFFSLFERFVSSQFSLITKNNKRIPINRFEIAKDPISTELYNIPDILLYPSRIKRFAKDVFTHPMIGNEFIHERYVPFLLSCETPLYEVEWWNYINNELLSENRDISLVINILQRNELIYLYESNLPYLKECWKKFQPILSKQDETFMLSAVTEIISIAFNSFKLFQQLGSPAIHKDIVDHISLTLKNPLLKKHLYGEESMYLEDNLFALAIFPILARYTEDPDFILTDSFNALLESIDSNRRSQFYASLVDMCKANPLPYKSYLGAAIYKKLEQYCSITYRESYEISPEAFKKLLT